MHIHYEGKWEAVGPWNSRYFWALWNGIEPTPQSPPSLPHPELIRNQQQTVRCIKGRSGAQQYIFLLIFARWCENKLCFLYAWKTCEMIKNVRKFYSLTSIGFLCSKLTPLFKIRAIEKILYNMSFYFWCQSFVYTVCSSVFQLEMSTIHWAF